jgi:Flp pilus assembly protein TadG
MPCQGAHLATLKRRLRNDRGSSVVEAVVILPLFLLLIFTLVQAGLFYYGRSAALAAAQQGLQAARVENGTTTAATLAAQTFLRSPRSGGSLLDNLTITPTRTAVTTTVTVSGTVPSLLPGTTFTVTQTATGTVERVTVPGTAPGGGA